MTKKREILSVSIRSDVVEAVRIATKRDNRNLSNVVETTLMSSFTEILGQSGPYRDVRVPMWLILDAVKVWWNDAPAKDGKPDLALLKRTILAMAKDVKIEDVPEFNEA